MATERLNTYIFEKGQFIPHKDAIEDTMQWGIYLQEQGYAASEQVWGQYPDVYIKVYEAPANAPVAFKFAAVLNLVCFPHHVFIHDLNGLVQLLQMLLPLFGKHSRPDEDTGDALFGSQGADDPAGMSTERRRPI